jgi:hypothetical protein
MRKPRTSRASEAGTKIRLPTHSTFFANAAIARLSLVRTIRQPSTEIASPPPSQTIAIRTWKVR